jgi:hypothetical protein
MDRSKKMYPVSIMFDRGRDSRLESISTITSISKSELLRISFDGFLRALGGDSGSPDMNALHKMLRRKEN